MACLRCWCRKVKIYSALQRGPAVSVRQNLYFCSKVSPDIDIDDTTNEYDSETEESLQDNRDISRLPKSLLYKMNHRLLLTDNEKNIRHASTKDEITYKRSLYAKYGKMSGINPGIMWPSVQDLQEIVEDERDWDKPLSEMIETVTEAKKAKLRAIIEKDNLVDKRMKEMSTHIEKYRKHLRDIKAEEERGRQRQNKLLEEAREFFGYDIQRHDAQFKAYEETKKEEELKLLKKQKKEERHAKRKQMHAITGEEKTNEQESEQVKQ